MRDGRSPKDLNSGSVHLILGRVFHARFRPKENKFSYPSFCLKGDVDEIMKMKSWIFSTGRKFPFGLQPKDYLNKDDSNLRSAVTRFLTKHDLWQDDFIYFELQTYPAVLGYVFNPVSFWYCLNHERNLKAVLVEVNNTFGERHFYWVQNEEKSEITNETIIQADKSFHVSPFFPVEGQYQFRFIRDPNREKTIINYFNSSNELELSTFIEGTNTAINTRTWIRCLLSYGWMTALVVIRIHWQAIRLFFKKAQFYRLPKLPPQEVTRWSKKIGPHGKSDSY